jgi:outer membrane lipoprotein-sorting protein
VRRDGEAFLREEQFANWHEFQGMPTALFITHFKDGEKTMEIRFDNVIYNPGLADSMFAPPAPSSK